MDKRVKSFLEGLIVYAQGGDAPARDLIGEVAELENPLDNRPHEAREYLWQILSYPLRGRALAVLNAVDLLMEMIPSWTAYATAQDLRLAAVDEVHLERWANGLSEYAFSRICHFHDAGVDQRLNGWALTSLATLLAYDSEHVAPYVSSLRLDLTGLGATEGEIERVSLIVTEFPLVLSTLSHGEHKSFKVLPGTLAAALSTMLADETYSEEQTIAAIRAADRWQSQK